MLITLLLVTFLGYFYAADLKGIWNDDAVRLTIANGGLAKAGIESRHPGHSVDVIEAIGRTCPARVPLLVIRILRLTRSYSIIAIVTTNLFIFLFSAIGIYLGRQPETSSSAKQRAPERIIDVDEQSRVLDGSTYVDGAKAPPHRRHSSEHRRG
jgi:hypothetical protein